MLALPLMAKKKGARLSAPFSYEIVMCINE